MRGFKKLFIFLNVLAAFSSYSQSKQEWYENAEEAYQKENYGAAAFYYSKVLNATETISKDIAFPYSVRRFVKVNSPSDTLKSIAEPTKTATEGFPANNGAVANKSKSYGIKIDSYTPIEMQEYIFHQMAESYRLDHDYYNAEIWYKRSLDNKPPDYPYERYWYAVSLINNQKYKLAKKELDAFKESLPKTDKEMLKKADKMIAKCSFGMNAFKQKKDVVQELDTVINSGISSFGATYFGDDAIVFSAARPTHEKNFFTLSDETYSLDVYLSKKSKKYWKPANKIDGAINSNEAHEVAGVFSTDKTRFYFTRFDAENKKECSIFLSKNINGKWLKPMKLGENVNLDGFRSMQPALSNNGAVLIFSSDRPGGKGKMDLWMSYLDENGHPTNVKNLGPRINTPEDEVAPSFNNTSQMMFFSSEGHTGFGGLDIFKSKLTVEDSSWSVPKNLGAPINSSRDDSYFVLDKEQKKGFLTSDRKKCKDCDGASNCYKIYSVVKDPGKFVMEGIVYNSITNDPIPNALVTFKDVHGNAPSFYVITDSVGGYSTPLKPGLELFVKAQKNKFFADATAVNTIGTTETEEVEHDFFLAPIPEGDIVIPGIEYDFDMATLRPVSIQILDDLVNFLNLNDNISVEISSHTDSRGTDEYNLDLSNRRAIVVVDYLISKGIPSNRMSARGYGFRKLLISDEEISRMTTEEEKEAAHQKNRRTAFRPVKENDIQSK